MRRTLLPVFALFLLASSLLAQPRASRDSAAASSPELRAVFSVNPELKEAVESRLLFFAPAADQLNDAQKLEFRISLNGKPYLEEALRLKRDEVGAFELLATRPALLDRLYQLAKQRSNRLTVQVFVDDRLIHEFSSFQELVRYNRDLKSKGFNPLPAPSEVRDHTGAAEEPVSTPAPRMTAKGMQPAPYCVDQCNADYDRCYDGGWGCDYGDCSRCQNSLDACLQYCPIVCVDPQNVSESTHTAIINYTYLGQQCLEHWWENDYVNGEWYDNTQITYKHTRVRTTTYCDGSEQQVVIGVWYSYGYCWKRSNFQCSNPLSQAQPTC